MALPLNARWEYMFKVKEGTREAKLTEVLKNPKEWVWDPRRKKKKLILPISLTLIHSTILNHAHTPARTHRHLQTCTHTLCVSSNAEKNTHSHNYPRRIFFTSKMFFPSPTISSVSIGSEVKLFNSAPKNLKDHRGLKITYKMSSASIFL